MLASMTPELIETTPYLTIVKKENPTISASGSSVLDYTEITQKFYYGLVLDPKKERISKKVVDPTDVLYDLFQQYPTEFQIIRKHEDLLTKVQLEYSKNKAYLNITENEFSAITDLLIENISKLNYERVYVELSPLNEIKFKTVLNDDTLLIITKPFEKLNENPSMVFYSVFINKKSVLNDYKNIEELVEGINQFIQ